MSPSLFGFEARIIIEEVVTLGLTVIVAVPLLCSVGGGGVAQDDPLIGLL